TLTLDLDDDTISLKTVCAAVKSAGYECARARHKPAGAGKRLFLIVIALTRIILLLQLNKFVHLDLSPEDIGKNADYALRFVVGDMSGFHCIGTWGGYLVSYTVAGANSGKPNYVSPLLYGLGETLSYAGSGALLGLIGGAMPFAPGMRSVVSAGASGTLNR